MFGIPMITAAPPAADRDSEEGPRHHKWWYPRRCEAPGCEARGEALLKCSACRMVCYCSQEHQRADWRAHKSECAVFRRLGMTARFYTDEQILARLLEWLSAHRSPDNGTTFFYTHPFESGMDNSPRFDAPGGLAAVLLDRLLGGLAGAVARGLGGGAAPGSGSPPGPHLLSVDLCALVAREMAHVARMLDELGRPQEAEQWAARSRSVATALVSTAWSPRLGMYGDVVHGGGDAVRQGGDDAGQRGGSAAPGGGGGGGGVLYGPPWRRRTAGVGGVMTVAGLLPLLAGRLPLGHLAGLLKHLQRLWRGLNAYNFCPLLEADVPRHALCDTCNRCAKKFVSGVEGCSMGRDGMVCLGCSGVPGMNRGVPGLGGR
ncbi:hypothetical protein TSOC_000005 [Tetrabaena socialis]|uniref:MYND-type domain-containing protein n=1 Tax=Tetrabaena socialis TaxID=47790 RepID=A0A2J8AKG2_9CHLO|nr:hypothetical protein TSOC_000005 [Tetrabaena socialis]|eukprot:PNH13007.1 hypothetical protein TSOC_000005 [Tetrabaena socialis]